MTRTFSVVSCATLVVFALGISAAPAATIFSDNFSSGSTLNAAAPAAPTANSADYAVLSSKNSTGAGGSSMAAGSFKLRIPSTSSGLNETQSRFAGAPVALTTAGDYIELSVTFVPTGILYASGNAASLGIGLYNSGGVNPINNGQMANAGMGSGTTFPNGFAQNWLGYVTKVNTAAGELFNRSAQTGTTNANQDLVFHSGVTGGFANPTGSQLPGQASGIVLTTGNTYTYVFRIALNGGGTLDLSQNIYAGAGTGGSNLYSMSGTTTVAQTITTSFDALAVGFRAANGTAPAPTEHVIDMSQITVVTGTVPEPATSVLGLMALAGLRGFRRRK
jgi:hypothetical protein